MRYDEDEEDAEEDEHDEKKVEYKRGVRKGE